MFIADGQHTAHPVSGLHDTFRHGLRSAGHSITADACLAASGSGIGALQARLEKVSPFVLSGSVSIQWDTSIVKRMSVTSGR